MILVCEKDNHETTIANAKKVLKKLDDELDETIWGEIKTSDGITWPDNLWNDIKDLSYNKVSKTIKNKL